MSKDRQTIIREWIESTEDAIKALQAWRTKLQYWQDHTEPYDRFLSEYQALANEGLDMWADGHPAGGGVDALAEAVAQSSLRQPAQTRVSRA